MQKIYSVMIKGRTLESRDLKELLARAVSEKRNSDRISRPQSGSCGKPPVENIPNTYAGAYPAAMF